MKSSLISIVIVASLLQVALSFAPLNTATKTRTTPLSLSFFGNNKKSATKAPVTNNKKNINKKQPVSKKGAAAPAAATKKNRR
jgi:hypothetical protein